MNVALVGGQKPRAFKQHLADHGVTVCGEFPTLPVRIPQSAEAILVVRDHCSHKLWDHCRKAAAQRNLPMVAVSQSWTAAQDILRQFGILPEPTTETVEIRVSLYDMMAVVAACHDNLTRREGRALEQGSFDNQADQFEADEQWFQQLQAGLEALPNTNEKLQTVVLDALGRFCEHALINYLNVSDRPAVAV
jgi:hypothetical protein